MTSGRKGETAISSAVVATGIAIIDDEIMMMMMITTGDGELDPRDEIGVYLLVIAIQGAGDMMIIMIPAADEMTVFPEIKIEIGIENAVVIEKETETGGIGNEVTDPGTMIDTVLGIHHLILRDIVIETGKEIEIVTAIRIGEGGMMIDRPFHRNAKAIRPGLVAMFNKIFMTRYLLKWMGYLLGFLDTPNDRQLTLWITGLSRCLSYPKLAFSYEYKGTHGLHIPHDHKVEVCSYPLTKTGRIKTLSKQ